MKKAYLWHGDIGYGLVLVDQSDWSMLDFYECNLASMAWLARIKEWSPAAIAIERGEVATEQELTLLVAPIQSELRSQRLEAVRAALLSQTGEIRSVDGRWRNVLLSSEQAGRLRPVQFAYAMAESDRRGIVWDEPGCLIPSALWQQAIASRPRINPRYSVAVDSAAAWIAEWSGNCLTAIDKRSPTPEALWEEYVVRGGNWRISVDGLGAHTFDQFSQWQGKRGRNGARSNELIHRSSLARYRLTAPPAQLTQTVTAKPDSLRTDLYLSLAEAIAAGRAFIAPDLAHHPAFNRLALARSLGKDSVDAIAFERLVHRSNALEDAIALGRPHSLTIAAKRS